ncbi:MAG: hypothetical protein P4L54_02945 [Acidocella sp.]|nr:hypothetical protein [Acidocella sp.]
MSLPMVNQAQLARNFIRLTMVASMVVLGMASVSAAKAQVLVPAVNCSGQLSPRQGTLPNSKTVAIDIPLPQANQIAMYVFNGGMLMGPRGWECHSQVGVQASAIALMPIGSFDKSQGEVYVTIIGDTQTSDDQGRYVGAEGSMSPWANTYFSEEMVKEADAGYGRKTTIKLHRYNTDTIIYPPPQSVTITDNIFGNVQHYTYTDLLAAYTTPEGHYGVGGEILLGFGHDLLGYGFMGYRYHGLMPTQTANRLSIHGYIKLQLYPGGAAEKISLFALALSKSQSNLTPFILSYAKNLQSTF